MMAIITGLVCCTLAMIIIILQARAHRNEMDEIAADYSIRMKQVFKHITILCKEPESEKAEKIKKHYVENELNTELYGN